MSSPVPQVPQVLPVLSAPPAPSVPAPAPAAAVAPPQGQPEAAPAEPTAAGAPEAPDQAAARFAAIEKEHQNLWEKHKQLKEKASIADEYQSLRAEATKNPLAALEKLGVNTDALFKAILEQEDPGQKTPPAPEEKLTALEQRLKDLQDQLESSAKRSHQTQLETLDAQYERTFAEYIVKESDKYGVLSGLASKLAPQQSSAAGGLPGKSVKNPIGSAVYDTYAQLYSDRLAKANEGVAEWVEPTLEEAASLTEKRYLANFEQNLKLAADIPALADVARRILGAAGAPAAPAARPASPPALTNRLATPPAAKPMGTDIPDVEELRRMAIAAVRAKAQ